MSAVRDLTGKRFVRLSVKERVGSNSRGQALWLCECDCGKTSVISSNGLAKKDGTPKTKSCGCLRQQGPIKHGLSKGAAYGAWRAACRRCHDPKDKNYYRYGGRGITSVSVGATR